MPRVILRTVEPANELACQSDEKRCTRWKALCVISLIILQRQRDDLLEAELPDDHRADAERHDDRGTP